MSKFNFISGRDFAVSWGHNCSFTKPDVRVVFEHPPPTAGQDGDTGPDGLLVTAIRGEVPLRGTAPLPRSQPRPLAHSTRPEEVVGSSPGSRARQEPSGKAPGGGGVIFFT